MNGQWLGRRTIRTNWASRKPTGLEYGGYQSKPTFDEIYNLTGSENSSVYIGNISTNLNGNFNYRNKNKKQFFFNFNNISDKIHI